MAKDPAPSDAKEKTQRRVYVLPNELVNRITEYQNELGLASEVEAARRLLDDALKRRDDFKAITTRLINQLKLTHSLREAAREILVDHPLVKNISFEKTSLTFVMTNDMSVEVNSNGYATVRDQDRDIYSFDLEFEGVPDWASPFDHPKPKAENFGRQSGGGRLAKVIDDDIPF